MDQYENNDERLRAHPESRAITESQLLDLGATLQQLRAEDHPAINGHRQMTIFSHAPVSMVLFAFEDGGALPEHVTEGIVTIQALEGTLGVVVDRTEYRLEERQALVLNPGIRHSVHAHGRSAMLLTVNLSDKKGRQDQR